jgi:hypothetical protein
MRLETGLDFTNLLGEEADGEFNIIFIKTIEEK